MKIFAFPLSLATVIFLGFQQRWHYTLSGDLINYYYPIARHVWTAGTLIYPPGANLFFLSLPAMSFSIYQVAFICVDIIFLLILLALTKKPIMLGLLILAAGPIILFRFDLLVVTLMVAALVFFQRLRYGLSGFFLGLAVATKIFPIVLLPYLLLVAGRKFGRFLLAFVAAIVLVFLVYAGTTGQSMPAIIANMGFVFSGTVHMESVLGTVLTMVTAFTNPGPHGVSFVAAVWALDPLYYLGHERLFRLLLPVSIAVIYLIIFLRRPRMLDISVCLLLIGTMIAASQLFSPQYMIWLAFLLPLAKNNRVNSILVLAALVCTQLIYPLNYGELIDFFNKGANLHLFLILAARNFLLVAFVWRLVKYELLPILPAKKS
ncbi:MAG: DUF2029 domain-containing protein [Patescibacteria group bacterium]|nr:DUF2029 domain-containing protein [Patescibacteria group bacterium]MCL5431541.1 DUF2029 domain-containing protein [Patescibacteria group bacterium]